jgi:hypothetical protein
MKEIKEYSSENLNRLKRWLMDMSVQGHPKYFEILVDGFKIINKTTKLEEFDYYSKWMYETTKSMRVLIYNTKNSHRSQVFEFRTENYVEGISDKLYPSRKPRLSEDEINHRVQQTLEEKEKAQTFADMQNKNQELIKRLGDAESYIQKIEEQLKEFEAEKPQKDDFDITGLLDKAALLAGNNPDLREQLSGIQKLFRKNEEEIKSNDTEQTQSTATFRRKPSSEETSQDTKGGSINTEPEVQKEVEVTYTRKASNEYVAPEVKENENLLPLEDDYLSITVPNSKLDDEKSQKMFEVSYFLSQNPEYIDMVHDLMKSEETKLAG